jgi:hypothetical protein
MKITLIYYEKPPFLALFRDDYECISSGTGRLAAATVAVAVAVAVALL